MLDNYWWETIGCCQEQNPKKERFKCTSNPRIWEQPIRLVYLFSYLFLLWLETLSMSWGDVAATFSIFQLFWVQQISIWDQLMVFAQARSWPSSTIFTCPHSNRTHPNLFFPMTMPFYAILPSFIAVQKTKHISRLQTRADTPSMRNTSSKKTQKKRQ